MLANFLKGTDWQRRSEAGGDPSDATNPLTALDLLRTRLRTRHYSYCTECIYADWVRRFLAYAATRQRVATPRVVMSMPKTASLLAAMSGTAHL